MSTLNVPVDSLCTVPNATFTAATPSVTVPPVMFTVPLLVYPDSLFDEARALDPIERPFPVPVTVLPALITTFSLSIRMSLNLSVVELRFTSVSSVSVPFVSVVTYFFPLASISLNLGIALNVARYVVSFPSHVGVSSSNTPRFTPWFISFTLTLFIPWYFADDVGSMLAR